MHLDGIICMTVPCDRIGGIDHACVDSAVVVGVVHSAGIFLRGPNASSFLIIAPESELDN